MPGNHWKGPKIVIYLSDEEKGRVENARIKAGGKAMSVFVKGLLFDVLGIKQREVRFDPSRSLEDLKRTDELRAAKKKRA